MVRAAGLLLPAAGGFGVLAFVLWLASPVAAAPPPSGNWSVTGAEAYLDQTITLLNVTDLSGNATEYGNLTVASSGDLTFDNVTLVLPFRAALDIQGRAVFRNSTVVGETWKLWLRGTVEFTDDTFVNATFGSIAVETSALVLERNLWNCSAGGGTIAVRRALDFRNQTLQAGCGLSYELPILTVNKDIEIANLSIRNTGSANGIQFNGALHTGRVRFDLHDLTLNGSGGWPLYVQAASPSTSYAIHDSAFSESGVAGIRCDSFDGGFAIWNMTFTNVLRAFRMDGLPSGQVVATADNVTVVGTTDSILANDITWVIRNSTIQGASPQFDAGTNGHIRIYDSVATAFAANYPSTGGSIEHFTWLAMGVPTWQGAVAITDDAVTLLDGNGLASIQVNASTWAPQEIVWWGMYPGSSRIDNRQLQPTVRDGGTAFNCTPSSFLVSPGMATVDVTCMDDAPPSFTVFSPTLPRIQNNSLLAGTARVDEAGSGLNTVEFSLDGLNYGPVAFAPGDTHNFSFSRAGMADGTYGIWLRARDRTANERVVTLGPLTLDTVDPALALDPRPPIVSGFAATISGTTEPNTSITVARVGGFTNSTTSTANGSFAVGVLLEEGQNAYTVTARDAAGNSYALVATTFVDTRAPSLSVSLDGKPDTAAVTRTATVRVAGNAEAGSTVRVSGALADRSGEGFSYDLALVRGLNLLNVTATDAAGNTATWYGLAYFDDVAPTVTISVDGEARTSGSTVITRSSTVGLSGVALDNETGIASLIVNGTAIAVAGSGDFSTALPVGEGENRVVVTASDSVGNTASFRFTVVRDTAAPGATASAAADASPVVYLSGVAYTRGATARLVVTVNEEGAVTFGGALHAVAPGENSFVVSLPEGRTVFAIVATDLAGNAALPLSVAIERKSSPPALLVSAPLDGATVDTAVVEVVGSADPLSSVTVNGQAVSVLASGEFRASVAITLGANALVIEASDDLGNTNETTRSVTRTDSSQGIRTDGTAAGSPLTALGLLIGGLVAGIAAGFLLGRRRPSGSPGPVPAGAVAPEPASEVLSRGAPQEGEPPSGPRPKGPRRQGPRPP